MEQIKIPVRCVITPTNSDVPLGITVLIDNCVLYTNPAVTEAVTVAGSFEDDNGDHVLRFVMSGKTAEMTKIDEQGNILQDTMLAISDLYMDDIDITTILQFKAEYKHDFNGTGDLTKTNFYGNMGCNGSVDLKFITPFYLWLLENM